MTGYSRRGFLLGAGAVSALVAGCANGIGSGGAETIDARVDATRNYLFDRYPGARTLADKSVGILYMPLITEAGFGFGGAYGRGALRIDGATVDYYSTAQGSVGFQLGVQQYAHTLFFMTEPALSKFRRGGVWVAGGDIEYALNDRGANLGAATITSLDPIIALVYGQAGLLAGVSLAGTKYTRIIP